MLTSNDLISLAGVSARQLQWWTERRYIRGGDLIGHRRNFSTRCALEFMILASLRAKGMKLDMARKVTAHVKSAALPFLTEDKKTFYAVLSGLTIKCHTSTDKVIDWATSKEGVRLLDVGEMWRQILERDRAR